MFDFARWLATTPPSMAVKTIPGLAQLLQVVHLLTAGVALASVLLIVLRLNGLVPAMGGSARNCPRNCQYLAVWFWRAMAIMAATGLAFILGEPVREFSALSFWLKLALLAGGSAGMLWLGRRFREQGEPTPAMRRIALAVLLLWICVGLLGRFIGYDIPIWGMWSPRAHL